MKIRREKFYKMAGCLTGIPIVMIFLVGNKMMGVSRYYPWLLIGIAVCAVRILIEKKICLTESLPLAALIILTLYSVILADGREDLGMEASYLIIFTWSFFLLAVCYTKREVEFLIHLYALSSMILALLIICSGVEYMRTGRLSIVSGDIAIDPNFLAGYMVFSAVFRLKECLACAKWKRRIPYLLQAGLILYGVLLTGSRASFLVLILAGAGILSDYYHGKNREKIKMLLCFIPVGALALMILWKGLPVHLFERYFRDSFADESNMKRLMLWRNAVMTIGERLFLGFGMMDSSEIIYVKSSAHNSFLALWLQMGVLGPLLLGGLLLRLGVSGILQRSYTLVTLAAGLFLIAMMDQKQYSLAFWIPFILVSLICRSEKYKRGERELRWTKSALLSRPTT